jgi:hypothetical protein
MLLQKLIVAQLVKKYHTYWNLKIYCRIHSRPPLDPILSQLNPVHTLSPYTFKIHLDLIIILFSSGFPTKGWKGVDWIHLAQDRLQWRAGYSEHGNELSASIRGEEFIG